MAYRLYDNDYILYQSNNSILIILKSILKFFIDFIPIKTISKRIDKISKKYDFNTATYVGGVMWGYGPQEKLQLEKVAKRVKVEFEGMNLYTFSCWDEYLTNLYGDYMILPPADKQISHITKFTKINK